jgi:hypothetical protein
MLILALVVAPLITTTAHAQRGNGNGNQGQNGRGRGHGDERGQKGEHQGNNDDRPTRGATINGTVFNDANSNMMRDAGEVGLSGWTVTLTGVATVSATTNATGGYSFTGVAPGSYLVCAVMTSGWAQTTQPRCWTADVTTANAAATITALDFGAFLIPLGGAV